THGLADRQRGGHGDATGVDDGILASVVEVEAVGESGVGQDRARRSRFRLGADQCALLLPAQSLGAVQDGAAELFPRRGETAHDLGRGDSHYSLSDNARRRMTAPLLAPGLWAVGTERAPADEAPPGAWLRRWIEEPPMAGNWFGARDVLNGWGINPRIRYGTDH